jgi:nitroimidazol reductase NimA-like FMN-containing flavoprotein (pyridoxamine 5'-phosphate oxidase superfamily)
VTESKQSRDQDERTHIRRADRAMPDESAIKALLHDSEFGFLATSVEDQPYLRPNLFWYDEDAGRIYFHSAREGRTIDNLRANPNACFGVARMGALLPAVKALGFSNEYASVIAFGTVHILEDDGEKEYGLQGLLDKYFPERRPGRDYQPITKGELDRTAVYAFVIEGWSGKQKVSEG